MRSHLTPIEIFALYPERLSSQQLTIMVHGMIYAGDTETAQRIRQELQRRHPAPPTLKHFGYGGAGGEFGCIEEACDDHWEREAIQDEFDPG